VNEVGRLLFLALLAEQVGGPVDQVEEREHQREGDARDDVDAFGARRELGEPRATAVVALGRHVDLARTHLLDRHRVPGVTHQRLQNTHILIPQHATQHSQ
jgi:hypothetical protein